MEKICLRDLVAQLSVALDTVEAELVGATKFHGKRVSLFCTEIGKVLKYDDNRLFNLAGCALLHDNALTEYILSENPNPKQGLNLKKHCIIGQQNCAYFPFNSSVEGFILYHHECADGSGTFGKKAGEYPQEAEIIALADKVDVRFKLNKCDDENIKNIKQYILGENGKSFTAEVSDAALQALNSSFIETVKDDNVSKAIKENIPNIKRQITEEEIIRLAEIIAKIIDYKSNFTMEHSSQIANKAWFMAGFYGYDKTLKAKLYLAAALHDIGKLYIPTPILEKPGKLTDEEFEIIKSHSIHTWNILKSIEGFEEIAQWASNHHEKLNGKGYPFGKNAEELDFNSRLLACLDIYQAVSEKRPYHNGRSHDDSMKIIYDMADNGLIDSNIANDLDSELRKLEKGYADFPKI